MFVKNGTVVAELKLGKPDMQIVLANDEYGYIYRLFELVSRVISVSTLSEKLNKPPTSLRRSGKSVPLICYESQKRK